MLHLCQFLGADLLNSQIVISFQLENSVDGFRVHLFKFIQRNIAGVDHVKSNHSGHGGLHQAS
jgi:hypothetical protein